MGVNASEHGSNAFDLSASPRPSLMRQNACMTTLNRDARAALEFVVLCVCWGSTFVAIKEGVSSVPPLLFAGARFVLAGGVLLAWVRVRQGGFRMPQTDAVRLVWPALLMIALNYGLMAWGVRLVPSGLSAVVNLAGVALGVLGFSLVYRQEAFSWPKIVGIGVGVLGLIVLFVPSGVSASGVSGANQVVAVTAIACGALAYAWGTVLGRAVARRNAPLEVSALQMSLGGVVLMVVSALTEPWNAATWQAITQPSATFSLVYLVVVGSLAGFTLYQSLLRVWPATRVALYTFICPVIAVVLGVLVFAERIAPLELVASGLMLLGAFVATRSGLAGFRLSVSR
jgi:drug/metabolite transporter (DMT)-like permease